jgi:predicted ATPase
LRRFFTGSARRRRAAPFFFRAETLVNFATTLEGRTGPRFARYGGESLHHRSHGEAFLEVFKHRVEDGLYLIDEPEAALSPQRQLALLYLLRERVERGRAQLIVATHSPILLTFPGSVIVGFDDGTLQRVALEETMHYQITRRMLECPERYWKRSEEEE